MTPIDHRIERLAGCAGSASATTISRPGFESCVELVKLVLSDGAGPLRREDWEQSDGSTLCVGSDFGLTLGLDFPGGERAGPDGGWIRSQRPDGALHWRIARQEAIWLWLLVRRALGERAAMHRDPGGGNGGLRLDSRQKPSSPA